MSDMKQILVAAAAITTLAAVPVFSQQSDGTFVPGAAFLTNWDTDEDGRVTLQELEQRRADLFSAFDENEDGDLSAEEFDALDDARSGSMQRPADRGNGGGRAEQMLSRAAVDTDGNGAVTMEEFRAATAAWMSIMDGDGDGSLTTEDFGPGARQSGQGMDQQQAAEQGLQRGQGRGMGTAQGQQQGRGQGKGKHSSQGKMGMMQGQQEGTAQGKGRSQACDHGKGQMGMMQGQQQDKAQGKGQRSGQGRGHGQQAGQSGKGGQQLGNAQVIPTSDGALWIVDSRTGDIRYCHAVSDGTETAGFVPVCVKAEF